MNDLPRQVLCQIIAEHGHTLCEDLRRCEALLKDYCGQHKREIAVLIGAMKARVPQELLSVSLGIPPSMLKARLVKRLYENLGIANEFADWAVESWMIAVAKDAQDKSDNSEPKLFSPTSVVAQDDKEAVKWYRLAAEQGDAIAQVNLGVMYRDGRGVAQDDKEAVKWYRLAAKQSDAIAQANLGFMYKKGRGVAQDDKEAVKWFRLAAEQGGAFAQNNLGLMYKNGRGVAQDDAEAVRWFRLAAEQGDAAAQNNLGSMYEKGRGVTQARK